MNEVLNYVLSAVCNPTSLIMVLAGTCMGLIFGALPGLSATMAVALLIPMTFTLEPVPAIGAMLGAYVGGMAGGAVASILLNIPGTPSAVVTTFDGYPMSKNGRAAEALGWAAFASGVGSLVSWAILVFAAPKLAALCTSFSAPEYAALAFFGLTIISTVSGKSMTKGLIAGLIGIVLSMAGTDPIWGDLRFTFGNYNLLSGVSTMPALIGLYSIPQILKGCLEKNETEKVDVKLKNFVPSPKKLWQHKWNLLRSSLIGTMIGIIPATGGNIASFIAYDQAKRFSKEPETFGKGNPDGVIASEAANNAVCGGALIPLLTLGIPGDSPTAVLLGGLMIHGLTPGPAMFTEKYNVIVGVFCMLLIATIFMVLLQMFGIKIFTKVLAVPTNYLSAALVVLSLVGSYALRSNMFDVLMTIALGLFGYLMMKAQYPIAPAVLGLVLGSMFEREFRTALRTSLNNPLVFFKRPVSCTIILIALAVLAWTVINHYRDKKKKTHSDMLI